MVAPKIDYTDRDFDAIKEALKVHLQTKFPNTWRSFYEADLGMAWLELIAYVFDTLSFYLDYQANETYLPTARDRLSIINICKLIGYKLAMPRAASVTCTATIREGAQANDVLIPAGTTIQSRGGVPFRTIAQQTIPALAASGDVTFYQGEQQTDSFTSDGGTFQKIQLTKTEIVHNTIEVTVDGADWDEINTLIYATDTSEVFEVTVDEDDNAYIEFGDGTSGMIPPLGATIVASYRYGGGVQGNIDLSEIDASIIAEVDILPIQYVSLDIENDTERGSGGVARESVEEAKFWAPRWVTANGRAVTEQDHDTLARSFVSSVGESVYRAKAMLRQEIPELNTVDIYVWGQGAGGEVQAASATVKAALQAYFDENGEGAIRLICTDVEIQDGNIVYIDIDLTATLESQFSTVAATNSISSSLNALFTAATNQPSSDVRISRVYDAIQDSDGVEHAVVNSITASYEDEEVDVGTGVSNYAHTDPLVISDLTIVPGTVSVVSSLPSQTITDDGEGNLIGDIGAGVNTVNYTTGVITADFAANVVAPATVTFTWRRKIDYARSSEVIDTGDGVTAAFIGAIEYPPIVPFVAGQKGIQITDGVETFIDNGAGVLAGDAGGVGTIDYDTGAYNLTFNVAPGLGILLYAAYAQLLETPSEDIPIINTQFAVAGDYTIVTE